MTFTTQSKPANSEDYAGCGWFAVLREGNNAIKEKSLCRTDERKSTVYRSSTNSLQLTFYSTAGLDTLPYFILEYSGE